MGIKGYLCRYVFLLVLQAPRSPCSLHRSNFLKAGIPEPQNHTSLEPGLVFLYPGPGFEMLGSNTIISQDLINKPPLTWRSGSPTS